MRLATTVATAAPTCDRQSRNWPKRDQDAGRNTGSGPEDGHAVRLGEQKETLAALQDSRRRQPKQREQSNGPICRSRLMGGRQPALDLLR